MNRRNSFLFVKNFIGIPDIEKPPFGGWLPFYRPYSFASLPFDSFAFIIGDDSVDNNIHILYPIILVIFIEYAYVKETGVTFLLHQAYIV